MARIQPLTASMNAGEISPRLAARTDFQKYPNSLETAINLIPLAEGGVMRRAGTRYVAEVETSTVQGRLLPFEFSTQDTHILEFGDEVLRFYRNQGQIQDGASPLEIATPWTEAQLPELRAVQSASVLYLFHPDVSPRKLQRLGLTNWTLTEVEWQDGPYGDTNTTATTLTLDDGSTDATITVDSTGGASDPITVTASSVTGINGGDGFQTTDVGRLIRFQNVTVNTGWAWIKITAHTSTTVVTAQMIAPGEADNNVASDSWRLGDWSDTTGWPQNGTFFEQRLFVAATDSQPQTLWASQTADFENFSPDNIDDTNDGTVEDDDALDFTLSADSVNAIRWMSAGEDVLAIGTTGGEWVPSSEGAVLTPLDITIRRQTTQGAAQVSPVRVGSVVLFVQRSQRKVRELGFSFESDGFRAPDMTRLAAHITKGGITEMAYQQEPDSLVWAVRGDGVLLSMTFRRDEDVVGWARHIIGGEFYGDIPQVWQADASAETYVDETTDANSATDADWALFPATEAVDDYVAFGAREKFTKLVFDYANGTAGVGGEVVWEYWNGREWADLTEVDDDTSGFTATAADNLSVDWAMPGDWKPRLISAGVPLYYVRARVTTVYSTNPVLDQGYISGHAEVESVATIPGRDGSGQVQSSRDRNEVWLIVKRTIDGATKRYVEVMERDFETGDDQEDAYYSDSLITYDGSATTTITGLDHLEGQTVKVWGDGAAFPDAVVASGQITLASPVQVAQIGLGYTHTLKTLKVEGGNRSGTAQGRIKRIHGVTFAILNGHTVSFGPSMANLEERDFRVVSDSMDAGAPLFTGEKFVEFEGDFARDTRIVLESDTPAPFTLLALIPEIDVREQV